jgi:ferritin-like metal-binding protein YciE
VTPNPVPTIEKAPSKPSQNALGELFIDTLKDVYSAEKQIFRALPRMARSAQMDELREAFEIHRDQTEEQIERLDQIFGMVSRRAAGPNCEAMEAILSEGNELMEAYTGSEAIDAGLIASGQSVEHYEIARYRSLRELAKLLRLDDAVTLLDETLKEEKETDRILTEIAESGANSAAQSASDGQGSMTASATSTGQSAAKSGAKGSAAATSGKTSGKTSSQGGGANRARKKTGT